MKLNGRSGETNAAVVRKYQPSVTVQQWFPLDTYVSHTECELHRARLTANQAGFDSSCRVRCIYNRLAPVQRVRFQFWENVE